MSRPPFNQKGQRPADKLGKISFALACLALLMSIGLMIYSWSQFINPADTKPEKSKNSLIILYDGQLTSTRVQLLERALSTAKYPVETLSVPEIGTLSERQDTYWLIAVNLEAETLVEACRASPQAQGIFLLAPIGLSASVADTLVDSWPSDQPLMILTSQRNSARVFFETFTGEDATLYPAYRQTLADPEQIATADGLTWLMTYPGLVDDLVMLSPRVLPDLVDLIKDWTSEAGNPATIRMDVPTKLAGLIINMIAAGLLLLAVPLALGLNRPVLSSTARPSGLRSTVLWLPAILAAAAVSLALTRLAGYPKTWLVLTVLLLPGFRGYLSLLGRLTGNPDGAEADNTSDRIHRLPGAILAVVTALAYAAWVVLLFGWPEVVWTWLVLLVLMLVSWPAGYADQPGSGQSASFVPFLLNQLPFLLLVVWFAVTGSLSGLIAALLLIAVRLLAIGLGKSVNGLFNTPLAGSIVQGVVWSLGMLVWPVFNLIV